MSVIGGVATAAASMYGTWALAQVTLRNLPSSAGEFCLVILLVVSGVAGFLAGSAICRRAARDGAHMGLFSALAGGVAGGLVGCVFAFTVTAAYLSSYTSWPQDSLDQVLVLLSYPVFGALGFCFGGLAGLLLGLLLGGAIRLAAHAR